MVAWRTQYKDSSLLDDFYDDRRKKSLYTGERIVKLFVVGDAVVSTFRRVNDDFYDDRHIRPIEIR